MRKNATQKLHDDAKKKVNQSLINDLEQSPDPFTALDKLLERDSVEVCAIIDSMSPLAGAFIIGAIKMRIRENNDSDKVKKLYQSIIDRAERLQLNPLQGFTAAYGQTINIIRKTLV